jgi:integrase
VGIAVMPWLRTARRPARRAAGLDTPRKLRGVSTDGHIPNDWFRRNVWNKAVKAAEIPFRVTPHGLRHAHASWLLAGGADLQVVKERLGHGSITTTERYLGTLPNADDAALAALDAVRGRRAEGTDPGEGKAEDVDSRDVELRQMRDMVQQLSAMLSALEK